MRLIGEDRTGSIVDIGCGYGGFAVFLRNREHTGPYHGIDIAESMVAAAERHCAGLAAATFAVAATPDRSFDYAVASGIFNVRLEFGEAQWQRYILDILDRMAAAATRGFAFNCLTSYSDPERMRPDLYYADPLALFDHCKRRYARDVALLHDYGLYEFTILVRKEL
jgi:cyclopropane fatty-acyl-phospholipid synthase-like methyltransferase